MARVGLFGGTFDPVHLGHLQLALLAQKLYQLETVFFIPAAVPPHKNSAAVAGFHHRVEMLRLALNQQDGLALSTVEGDLPKPSYTIDTLRSLLASSPGADCFFLVGSDSFLTIPSWKSWRTLLQLTNFVVFVRDFSHVTGIHELLRQLGYVTKDDCVSWFHPLSCFQIYTPQILSGSILDISSTRLRHMSEWGLSTEDYLHPDVYAYIREHSLYGLSRG